MVIPEGRTGQASIDEPDSYILIGHDSGLLSISLRAVKRARNKLLLGGPWKGLYGWLPVTDPRGLCIVWLFNARIDRYCKSILS